MKKVFRICIMVGLMALTMALTACSIIGDCFSCIFGCGDSYNDSDSDSSEHKSGKTYVVRFEYNGEEYSIETERFSTYRFTSLPRKEGYVFAGLYDSETGGDMIVDEEGYSLDEFTGRKTLTLYPRFHIAEYIVHFSCADDYWVDASALSSIKVIYGEEFTPPLNVMCVNAEFDGWFTDATGGRRVTNAGSVVEGANVLNSNNFALPMYSPYEITLYARFKPLTAEE